MTRTLREKYDSAYFHISMLEWRIFRNRKKVCSDYGKSYESDLDNAEVVKAEIKVKKDGSRYVRVTIK